MYSDHSEPYDPSAIKTYSGYYTNVKNRVAFNGEVNIPTTPRPTEIHVDALPTVATVTWSSEGSYWELQYKADSETEWHKLNATEKSCEITGLMPKTKYRVRIRNINSGASYWLSTEFTTLDNMPTDITKAPLAKSCTIRWTGYSDSYDVLYREASDEPSFFEDFEGGFAAKGWSVNTIGQARNDGQGWFTEDVTSRSTEEATYTNYSGSKCAVAESWASGVGGMEADNWLISPLVDLGGTLKFWQWTSDSYADSYEVMVTAGEVINFTTVRPLSPGARGWSQVVADLSEFQGKQGFIAIHHKCTDMFWMAIDDFGIYPVEGWTKVATTECQVTLTDLQPETTYELRITGFSDGEAEIVSDIVTFTTTVLTPIDLVLNCKGSNSETIQANDGASVNATIANLTLKKDGKWQAVCLPFDVDVENSPLAGADVRTLESVTVTNAVCTLDCPTPQTMMEANKPYILRWDEGEDIVEPQFQNVKIECLANPQDSWTQVYDGKVQFGGDYSYVGVTPNFYYLAEDNPILTRAEDSTSLHAFEGFFYINNEMRAEASVFVLNTGYEDDLITGIAGVNANADSDAIYNLAGQRLSKTQKGVNIVGSKKILVK